MFKYLLFLAEKDRLQAELQRLRNYRRDHETKKELMISKARVLQARAAKFKDKVRFFITKTYLDL